MKIFQRQIDIKVNITKMFFLDQSHHHSQTLAITRRIKFFPFMYETVGENKNKQNSRLIFVADIIRNRVKPPFHPKHNLSYFIEEIKIHMNILRGKIS